MLHLDGVDHVLPVDSHTATQPHAFQGSEEALHDGTVPTVPLPAHRGLETIPLQRDAIITNECWADSTGRRNISMLEVLHGWDDHGWVNFVDRWG